MPSWLIGNAIAQWALYSGLLLLSARPVGSYMYRIFTGQRTFLHPVLRPIEAGIYRITRVDEEEEMRWYIYMLAILSFSIVGLLITYGIERTQRWHGAFFNPQGFPNVTQVLAWNTAVSFTTNTNWQNYTGEATMSYLTQMAGLATHNWMSASTGIVAAVALVRGLARRSAAGQPASSSGVGSFWVDLVRCVLYLLLPMLIVFTFFLIWQGVPQNFSA